MQFSYASQRRKKEQFLLSRLFRCANILPGQFSVYLLTMQNQFVLFKWFIYVHEKKFQQIWLKWIFHWDTRLFCVAFFFFLPHRLDSIYTPRRRTQSHFFMSRWTRTLKPNCIIASDSIRIIWAVYLAKREKSFLDWHCTQFMLCRIWMKMLRRLPLISISLFAANWSWQPFFHCSQKNLQKNSRTSACRRCFSQLDFAVSPLSIPNHPTAIVKLFVC